MRKCEESVWSFADRNGSEKKKVRKCVPSENVTEASLVSEMEIVGAATLQEAVE